ncbi:hypothetical protein P7K49_030037 [Saguinus oedipus]|uniref:Uncharacterized protein n=1 Tax=Saguinus oedipus TaxID=9490 RepID=A0ABQ9U110_SAGOE|nr:hypothetical protein P7K49_030037 [Saguinus oedipus]
MEENTSLSRKVVPGLRKTQWDTEERDILPDKPGRSAEFGLAIDEQSKCSFQLAVTSSLHQLYPDQKDRERRRRRGSGSESGEKIFNLQRKLSSEEMRPLLEGLDTIMYRCPREKGQGAMCLSKGQVTKEKSQGEQGFRAFLNTHPFSVVLSLVSP